MSTKQKPEGIAIIGMACRFPGASDWRQFWRNLCGGVESVTFFTDDELLAAGVDPDDVRQPDYVKAGFVLPDPEGFDTGFFGYSPHEARLMSSIWGSLADLGELIALARREPLQYTIETLPLEEAQAAHDRLRSGEAKGRLVLVP